LFHNAINRIELAAQMQAVGLSDLAVDTARKVDRDSKRYRIARSTATRGG
jgi:hypothetical protein